jgi:hypothetical protein
MKGGARVGAGRKEGSATAKTRAIADRAAEEGLTPLEVMLCVMREQWELYQTDKTNSGAAKAASDAARDAAPFIHPRLANVDAPVDIGPLTGDLASQGRTVLEAIAAGTITPNQGATLMQTIASHARIIEVDELEKRVGQLEKANGR